MLVQAIIPGDLDEAVYELIEDYFYETVAKYDAKIRKVRIRRFEPVWKVAPYLGWSEATVMDKATDSKTLHGIILPNNSLVLHPDGVYKEIGKMAQSYLKKATGVGQHPLQKSKNRQSESIH